MSRFEYKSAIFLFSGHFASISVSILPIVRMETCRKFGNMSVFTRSILGIVLAAGLSFVIGCTSAQPGGKTAAMPNPFASWMKQKEPEGASRERIEDVIARPRPTVIR